MRRISQVVVNLFVNTVWRLRPAVRRAQETSPSPIPSDNTRERRAEQGALRALIRRFPYWTEGRALLAKQSLEADDVATAYAEAQALLALAPKRSRYHGVALFELGRCFLRRNDSSSALAFLDEARVFNPNDPRIQEERSAALVLQGEKARALEILKTISPAELSAEGKAALKWLSS